MAPSPLVQLEKVSRRFGEHHAVQALDLTLRAGEVVGFLGPNGAGKSTTMRMISGNLAPSAGRITIDGVDLLESPKEAKRQLGYLPETPPLYRDFTVDEYLRYCAQLNRITRPQVATAIDTAKQRCGLENVGARLIGNLSKGYQQRVGIAQAIIHTPKVVILDEPTVGLDPIQIREIRDLIRELGRSHSVLLSTHLLPEVVQVCSRVEIIHQGQRVYSDSVAALTSRTTATSTLVAFASAPDEEALADIAGVDKVEKLNDNRFRLNHRERPLAAEELTRRSVAEGWGLCELTPESKGLEQIFVELTAGEGEVGHRDAGAA